MPRNCKISPRFVVVCHSADRRAGVLAVGGGRSHLANSSILGTEDPTKQLPLRSGSAAR